MGKYSENLHKRVSTRGPKEGYCAICREHSVLTNDHVPPKGCGNFRDVSLEQFLGVEGAPRSNSQGGHKFRTICGRCNNQLLGKEYDPELIRFYREVINFARSLQNQRIVIPPTSSHFIKPQRVIRSIVGHLLATHYVDLTRNDSDIPPLYRSLSEYFLNADLPVPENINIYYWLYPYKDITIVRGIAKSSIEWDGVIMGDIIKFSPFGFWLVFNLPRGLEIKLPQLIERKNASINQTEQIEVNYRSIPYKNFPEMPEAAEYHLFNTNLSCVAKAKR